MTDISLFSRSRVCYNTIHAMQLIEYTKKLIILTLECFYIINATQ